MPDHDPVRTPPRALVTGVPVDAVSTTRLVDTVAGWARADRPRVAVGVNANVAYLARADTDFRAAVDAADLAYADGQSVVWAANLLHGSIEYRIPERIATTDLIHPVAEMAAREGNSLFFYGGRPEVVEAAAKAITRRYGVGVEYAHGYLPPADAAQVAARVNESGAQILFVGLGDPMQQHWVTASREELRCGAILTCGGLFDWISGTNKRAPGWMIRFGLEWLWRLILEPRRLARRYLLGNTWFVWRLLRDYARTKTPGVASSSRRRRGTNAP